MSGASGGGDCVSLDAIRRDGGGSARSSLLFSTTGQAYAFNWNTSGMPPGAYAFTFALPDGSRWRAAFTVR